MTPPVPAPNPSPRPPLPPPVARHFHVQYRACVHDHWRAFDTLDCLEEARELAGELSARGYQVRVVTH